MTSDAAAWFERTGHCHKCGQPGAFCLCTVKDPCGCAHLHPVGPGLVDDPLVVFAEPSPPVEQDGLWP